MTTFGRIFRQLIFAVIFFALVGGSGYWSYKNFFPTLPSCNDGIKNQDETGVDCGGVCEIACPLPPKPPDAKEIEVRWAKTVENGANTYDLAAKITNANKYWGLQSFIYEFEIKDESGATILTKKGESYILPESYDYIIVPSQKIDTAPASAELKLSEEKWASVNANYGISSLSFPIREKRYTARDENGFPSVSGILTNGTTYDFDKVDIKIALFNDAGGLAGVNVLDMRTILAKEDRYFRSVWEVAPSAGISNIDFVVTTNVFDSTNFMRRYGTGDKVEEYR